eukprot:239469_1
MSWLWLFLIQLLNQSLCELLPSITSSENVPIINFVEQQQLTIDYNISRSSSRSLLQNNDLNTTSLKYFCVSLITAQCDKYIYDPVANPKPSNISHYTPNLTISDIPGTSIVFYVFGFDEFAKLLNTSEYSIIVRSNESIVVTPSGVADAAEDHYIISIIINIGSNDTNGFVSVYDQNNNINNIDIELMVKGCDPGYFQ